MCGIAGTWPSGPAERAPEGLGRLVDAIADAIADRWSDD